MKHTIFSTALLMAGTISYAQDAPSSSSNEAHSFTSKNHHEVLPQAKDWGLGISATGVLSYFGNMMNGNVMNNAPSFNSANEPNVFGIGNINGMALNGKYMKSSTMAYRGRFMVNVGSTSYHNNVFENLITPDPLNPQYVEDVQTNTAHVVLLSGGIEKRRGSGRLQGIYGGELLVGFSGNKRVNKYGNGYSFNFQSVATTTDFATGASNYVSTRTLETYSGNSILAGVRGFGGVEYFFAPKMSIGGEIGYTLGFSTNSKGYTVTETWIPQMNQSVTINRDTYPNSGIRSFGIGLDNVNAGINLSFYF